MTAKIKGIELSDVQRHVLVWTGAGLTLTEMGDRLGRLLSAVEDIQHGLQDVIGVSDHRELRLFALEALAEGVAVFCGELNLPGRAPQWPRPLPGDRERPDRERWLALRDAGWSTSEIAWLFHYSTENVRHVLAEATATRREFGIWVRSLTPRIEQPLVEPEAVLTFGRIPKRRNVTGYYREKLIQAVAADYVRGVTIRPIADALGRSYAFVYQLLEQSKVTLRPRVPPVPHRVRGIQLRPPLPPRVTLTVTPESNRPALAGSVPVRVHNMLSARLVPAGALPLYLSLATMADLGIEGFVVADVVRERVYPSLDSVIKVRVAAQVLEMLKLLRCERTGKTERWTLLEPVAEDGIPKHER